MTTDTAPKPHPVVWTPERVKRFFGHLEALPNVEDQYFSRQRGHSLLKFVRKHISLSGPVLDVGCGPGYFLDHLVANEITCSGTDLSESAVGAVKERLSSNAFFRGVAAMSESASLPYDTASFQTVFLIETIEHLLPDDTGRLLREISRVLEPQGRLIITTPNREDLRQATLICPECGCAFHRVQHLRSFDSETLAKLVSNWGFEPIICTGAPLLPDWKIWLHAQRKSAAASSMCPECGNEFQNRQRRPWASLRKILREIRHLVCICRRLNAQ